MQPGDVSVTYADVNALEVEYDFKPTIDLRTVPKLMRNGIKNCMVNLCVTSLETLTI